MIRYLGSYVKFSFKDVHIYGRVISQIASNHYVVRELIRCEHGRVSTYFYDNITIIISDKYLSGVSLSLELKRLRNNPRGIIGDIESLQKVVEELIEALEDLKKLKETNPIPRETTIISPLLS